MIGQQGRSDGPAPTKVRAGIGPLEAARQLLPDVAAAADDTERGRRPPPALVASLAQHGLFAMGVPREVGGLGTDAGTMLRAVEELSRADASTGWCVAIASTAGMVYGWHPHIGREAFAPDPRIVTCGVFQPRGLAHRVPGGYRVTGRWPFASGCQLADWMSCGAVIAGAEPVAGTMPATCTVVFPASDMRVIDTWDVSGLRGSGSHDVEVEDIFVPDERVGSPPLPDPRGLGPLYAFPPLGLAALAVSAVSLGIAASAIDALTLLAIAKTPTASTRRLGERDVVQAEVAQATSLLRSARAYFYAAVDEAWEQASLDADMSMAVRTNLRLAASRATANAAQAVDAMYTAGGGTANFTASPLQRCFRDVHAITQHISVAPPTWELCGRSLLGIDTDKLVL